MGRLSDHPYIVPIYDAGITTTGRPYIVMAFMPGGSLAARLAGGAIPWQVATDILIKVASALEAAHRLGVVHGDVKPGNILLSRYGEPQLTDFGVARLLSDAVTLTRTSLWTAAHVAPEILHGGELSPASDVYSLASTGYALLRGLPPFVLGENDSLAAVLHRIVHADPPPLRGLCPESVEEVLRTALARDVGRRYSSALLFGRALAHAQEQAGMRPTGLIVASAGPTTLSSPAAAPSVFVAGDRRRRLRWPAGVVLAFGAAALLAGVVAAVAALGPWRSTQGSAPEQVFLPDSLARLPDGSLIFTDLNRIMRVDANGHLSVFAGTSEPGSRGDGDLATKAELRRPTGLAVDGKGNVFVADSDNDAIREVRTDGTIVTVAGAAFRSGYGGDGGPATNAQLDYPIDVVALSDGSLLVADASNQVIRRIGPDGTITTFAGSSADTASSDDNTPALSFAFAFPSRLAAAANGVIFVLDDDVVYRIAAGRVYAYAGNQTIRAFRGDGGPATQAGLDLASGIAVDRAGNLYIADTGHNRIREVTPDGIMHTVAGDGGRGPSPPSGPALNAELDSPSGVLVEPDGSLLILDSGNRRILSLRGGFVTTVWQYQPQTTG